MLLKAFVDHSNIIWPIFGAAVLVMLALFAFIPGNRIYTAPPGNKAGGLVLLLAAAGWLVAWGKDMITLSSVPIVNNLVTVGIGVILTILGLCVLVVWHK